MNLHGSKGAALVEWGILVALIAIAALIAVGFTGEQNSQVWSQIGQSLANA